MASAFLQKVTSLPKVVTVTGAASGIGLATAKSLAQLGCAVSLADINLDKLEEAASAIKAETPDARLLITALDIRDRPAVARWIADTEEKLGTLSGSFNAAGAATASHGVRPLLETPDEEWDDTIGINLTGTMNCVKQQVRAMKASQTRGGSIVVVASVGGLVGTENGAAYSAAKFGTVGLIRSAARETASFGIRIVGIAPGIIKTPMILGHPAGEAFMAGAIAQTPLRRAAEPDEIADLALFLLSGASSFVTGSIHTVDGGLLA